MGLGELHFDTQLAGSVVRGAGTKMLDVRPWCAWGLLSIACACGDRDDSPSQRDDGGAHKVDSGRGVILDAGKVERAGTGGNMSSGHDAGAAGSGGAADSAVAIDAANMGGSGGSDAGGVISDAGATEDAGQSDSGRLTGDYVTEFDLTQSPIDENGHWRRADNTSAPTADLARPQPMHRCA